ncbi:hypothetical protein KKG46_01095 [Patescibacteria group bacterium]|nr:hypothetical protein [Patescibacteria group bacterium]
MIKSGIWKNGVNISLLPVLVIGSVVIYFLGSFLRGVSSPNPLEIFLWYPLLYLGGIFSVVVIRKYVFKKVDALDWNLYQNPVIVGLGIALIVYLLGFWGRDLVSSQLSVSGIAQYLVSFGFFPFSIGPDAMLRGFAWGVSVVFAYKEYKENEDIFSGVIVGMALCLAINIFFLIPSMILLLVLLVNGLGFSGQIISELGSLTLNSYWNNAQLIRWFTGFGGQAVNSVHLFNISWVFLIDFIVWGLLSKDEFVGFVRIMITDGLLKVFSWVSFAMLLGVGIGLGRSDWVLMDFSSVVVFMIVVISGLFLWRVWANKQNENSNWLLFFYLFGSFILGWPVFGAALVFLSFAYLVAGDALMNIDEKFFWLKEYLLALGLSFLSFQFVRRGADSDVSLTSLVGVFSFFQALYFYARYKLKNESVFVLWQVMGLWLILGGILAIIFKVFVPLAIILLGCVLFFVILRLKRKWSEYVAYMILLTGVLILLLTVILPRLADPRLLPV